MKFFNFISDVVSYVKYFLIYFVCNNQPDDSYPTSDYTLFVVCAANRHRITGRIITGARHYDTIMRLQMESAEGSEYWKGCEQGFIDQRGNFLTREEARILAYKNGQIRKRCGGDHEKLFSENLY